MGAPSPSIRKLAERLLVASCAAPASDPRVPEVAAVCQTLRISLTKFAGAEGFTALMRRSLALARYEVAALSNVKVGANGHLEGLEEVVAGERGAEAAIAITANLLHLLITFIGEPLTLRLVREAWPDTNLDV